jgi:hypothetical protein
MIGEVHRRYRSAADSPVNTKLYLRALSSEFALEGRYHGGVKGAVLLSRAILCNPLNRTAWASLYDLARRGMRRYIWHRR